MTPCLRPLIVVVLVAAVVCGCGAPPPARSSVELEQRSFVQSQGDSRDPRLAQVRAASPDSGLSSPPPGPGRPRSDPRTGVGEPATQTRRPPVPDPVPAPPPQGSSPRETGTPGPRGEGATAPGPAASPREPVPGGEAPRRTNAEVKALLARLGSTPASAEEAIRELWEVDAALLPDLIPQVENGAPSQLRELKIYLPDRDLFARKNVGLDARGESFVYEIPGMGQVAFDDIASGPARARGVKLVLKRSPGSPPFSVGEALRSALLNRIKSTRYPSLDHRLDLLGWWSRYYEAARSEL